MREVEPAEILGAVTHMSRPVVRLCCEVVGPSGPPGRRWDTEKSSYVELFDGAGGGETLRCRGLSEYEADLLIWKARRPRRDDYP